jgi:hypothetical protein
MCGMASVWLSNAGISIAGVYNNSDGNNNKNFWVFVSGAQNPAGINGDPNGWKQLDVGEMSNEDYLSLVSMFSIAHANNRQVYILAEHFIGELTGFVKGMYAW